MPKFAANLTWLFTELPFVDRFAAAADAGFRAVEYTFPYEHDAEALRAAAEKAGVTLVLFNTPGGDAAKGERGMAAVDPTRFQQDLKLALKYAEILQPRAIHVMAGLANDALGADGQTALFTDSLLSAMASAPTQRFVIEALNTIDNPGYFLTNSDQADRIVTTIDSPNLRQQFDFYHIQIMQGDLATRVRALLPRIGHLQIAGVPGRAEPYIGEVNYPYLFDLIDELGYDGYVGCEYRPRTTTEAGLNWFQPYGERQ